MSKRVEFERYRYTDQYRDWLDVEVHNAGTEIALRVVEDSETACVAFTDPAKLDALADAIKRAADALRKSQQVTFGDLKPGEWFRFKQDAGNRTCMRTARSSGYIAPDGVDHISAMDHQPVVRLRATFEPVGSP